MSDNLSARARILALIEILTMYTDEFNTLTAEQICEKLIEYGYNVTKRTVLSDLKIIDQSPYDIIKVSREKGYYILRSHHQSTTRKILAAVYSSPIISEDDVEEVKRSLKRNCCVPTLELFYETTESLTGKRKTSKIPFDLVQPLRIAIKERKRTLITYSEIIPGDCYSEPNSQKNIEINPIKIVISCNSHALIFTRPQSPQKAEYINLHRVCAVQLLDGTYKEFCKNHLEAVSFFTGEPLPHDKKIYDWLFLRFKKEYVETVDDFFSGAVQYKKDSQENFCLAKVYSTIDKELLGWLYHMHKRIEVMSPKSLKNYFENQIAKLT